MTVMAGPSPDIHDYLIVRRILHSTPPIPVVRGPDAQNPSWPYPLSSELPGTRAHSAAATIPVLLHTPPGQELPQSRPERRASGPRGLNERGKQMTVLNECLNLLHYPLRLLQVPLRAWPGCLCLDHGAKAVRGGQFRN
jgi:hypothetical protein